ncbi:hypothetical protein PAXRUDRAFT_651019 [Paxillus rubicundulus Ve08.2h10]|uniref:Uncharacterized protein n=1 Tax=Paxillus rubicundulus Ve08.2h10 TaxID=930991 RepID=A0A0D0DJ19_9AGAM|nr:hypothetical protein PAXRUDRAFT_651019 [Paxillus rubicundulus Ve08.2h10]
MEMYPAQSSVVPASSSGGSMKRQLSPELAYAHGSSIPVAKSISRRPTKRTKPSPATHSQNAQEQSASISQSMRTTQGSRVPSPVKVSKGRSVHTARSPGVEGGRNPQPVVFQAIIRVPPPNLPPPTFSGNFDLYGMYLPFLAKVYLPAGATIPDYTAVYDRILASQAKHDSTARCFLAPPDTSSSAPPFGRFESSTVLDPMVERPFDIKLGAFTYKKSLTFTPTERTSFQAPDQSTDGPGLVGHTDLPVTCGIKGAKGVFKIRRVWATEDHGSTKELFEGFFSFGVCYDSMYRKAGHGNGAAYKFAFWAVRAMKDNTGKEIGLGLRKAMW